MTKISFFDGLVNTFCIQLNRIGQILFDMYSQTKLIQSSTLLSQNRLRKPITSTLKKVFKREGQYNNYREAVSFNELINMWY